MYQGRKEKPYSKDSTAGAGPAFSLCPQCQQGWGFCSEQQAKSCLSSNPNLIAPPLQIGYLWYVYGMRREAFRKLNHHQQVHTGALAQEAGRGISQILVKLRVQHRKKVRDWVNKHTQHIASFFLLPYYQEINPHKHLNCYLKALAQGRKSTRTRNKLKLKVQHS